MANGPVLPGVPLSDERDYLKALFVGPIGSGKTTALAHLAHLGPVIFINAEGGIKKKPLIDLGVPVENIRVVAARSYSAMDALFWQLKETLDDDPNCIAGVVWDSISDIVSRFVNTARQAGYDKAVAKAEAMGIDPERSQFFVSRDDWGEESGQVKDLLMKYRDLPCHFGVSALPRRDVDSDGTVHYAPAVNPAVGQDLMGKMDVVGWTEVELLAGEEVYSGLFRAGGTREVKDRFKALPRVLYSPTFDRILDYVEGRLNEDDDPIQTKYQIDGEESEDEPKARTGAIRRRRTRPTAPADDQPVTESE